MVEGWIVASYQVEDEVTEKKRLEIEHRGSLSTAGG